MGPDGDKWAIQGKSVLTGPRKPARLSAPSDLRPSAANGRVDRRPAGEFPGRGRRGEKMIREGTVKDVNSKEELDDLLRRRSPAIVYFWASRCEASKRMDQVFSQLCTDFPYAYFFRVGLSLSRSLWCYWPYSGLRSISSPPTLRFRLLISTMLFVRLRIFYACSCSDRSWSR